MKVAAMLFGFAVLLPASAYILGGAIFGLAFVLYYLYFARLDVPEAGLEPATARSRA